MIHTLVIGAGPFGLALAAYLKHQGIDHLVVGKPMEFWEKNMPEGMYLRSGCDWHLDVNGIYTMEAFLEQRGLSVAEVEPIALEFYLEYVGWFLVQSQPNIYSAYVVNLRQTTQGFVAELDDHSSIEAQNVVVAVGFQYFAFTPTELLEVLPSEKFSHTCQTVHLEAFAKKRVLIIGGRQSAFEWAALLPEKGAAYVHLSYRHDTPQFAEANWGWVMDVVNNIAQYPTWFRELNDEDKEKYRYRLWAEGRLKVEPWLDERVHLPNVSLHPHTQVVNAEITPDDSVKVTLSNGEVLEIDHIITATGYKVETSKIPFLSSELLSALNCANGFPRLDAHFQSNIPGLYFTSFMAGQDFGPFFGFTIGVRTAAQLIVQQLPH